MAVTAKWLTGCINNYLIRVLFIIYGILYLGQGLDCKQKKINKIKLTFKIYRYISPVTENDSKVTGQYAIWLCDKSHYRS